MKRIIRTVATSGLRAAARMVGRTASGRYFSEQILQSVMVRARVVRHGDVELTFATPNRINRYRADTLSTKEPETLEWIDRIPAGAILWDIGANVGLYTCYAAKARGCRVIAFEPSVFNLELLARNVFVNGLVDTVTIVPLALSDTLAASTLNMTSTDWGGALSTFGKTYGHDGQELDTIFRFQTLGLSMVDAVNRLGVPQPDYVKLDVDGIEHLILKGGGDVLRRVRSLLIEVNDDFNQQRTDVARYLADAGMALREKRHSELCGQSAFGNAYNQIWERV